MAEVASGSRVLVVEDDLDVMATIAEAFAREGWDCVCADTDAFAYRELERAPESFAVLVADINLGRDSSGFDVARQARFRNPKIAVVYISGEGEADIRRFGVWGAELLAKPFQVGDLTAMARRLAGAL
jgi:two-component system OmpR family response regulator